MTCPHGPQSGSELASKLRVGYSSNMHEASLSAGLPLHRWVLARRPCPPLQLAVMSPCGGQHMRGRLQNIADGGVVIYAPACPDARHPYVITQCKRSAAARLLQGISNGSIVDAGCHCGLSYQHKGFRQNEFYFSTALMASKTSSNSQS